MAMQPPADLGRRALIRLAGGALALGAAGLAGCNRQPSPLRIASNVWPGYELLYLAAARQHFSPNTARMIALPSATACLQALSAGTVEGACLTLDEVLSAAAENLPLKVIAILDVSLGADLVLGRPEIRQLADLRGKRIGVEQTAVGAVMLDALLSEAGLATRDVQIVYCTVDQHDILYREGKVDALVTFEPVPTRLEGSGAVRLFDSARVPGRIVDVLAVRPEVADRHGQALAELVAGHFKARSEWLADPGAAAPLLAPRLGLRPDQVPTAFVGIALPDLAENRAWLAGHMPRLNKAAADLAVTMLKANLLPKPVPTAGLADPGFLG